MQIRRTRRASAMGTLACAAAALVALLPCTAARSLLQAATQGELIESMHCYQKQDVFFFDNANWRPADHFRGSGLGIKYVGNPDAETGTVFSSICQGTDGLLEFLFSAPIECPLKVRLLFATPNDDVAGRVRILINGKVVADDFNVEDAGAAGATRDFDLGSPSEQGLLDVAIRGLDGISPIVSGIQVFAGVGCKDPSTPTHDTTEEINKELESADVVYRMACSALDPTASVITGDVNQAQSKFMDNQAQFVDSVSSIEAAKDLFGHLCVPALDSDHVSFDLPLTQDTTYEVIVYLSTRSAVWSTLLVTIDGHDVQTSDREVYARGPSESAAYVMKKFEVRPVANVTRVTLSAGHGFPPLSGLEVHRVNAKDDDLGSPLLDSPDDTLVAVCASNLYAQTPAGEVLYPGSTTFAASGRIPVQLPAKIHTPEPELRHLKAGKVFDAVCEAPEPIIATFDTTAGKQYAVTVYFVEAKATAAGQRVLDVAIDGKSQGAVDIFAKAGLKDKAYAHELTAVASKEQMEIKISATEGLATVSAIKVVGPGVDRALASSARTAVTSGRVVAAACGAPGEPWTPLDHFLAAGYMKYTSQTPLAGLGPLQAALYGTSCMPKPGVDGLTMQFPVTPGVKYRVVLHLAETEFTAPGERVFDILVDGLPQEKGVDLVKLAGKGKHYMMEFVAIPKTSYLTVEVKSVTEDAIISGVELFLTDIQVAPPKITEVNTDAPVGTPTAPTGGSNAQMCVQAQGNPKQVTSDVTVSPSTIGFGEVAPNAYQANFASLTFSNSGSGPKEVTHISCKELPNADAKATDFAIQFSVNNKVKCGAPGAKVALSAPFQVFGSGAQMVVTAFFEPTDLSQAAAKVTFWANDQELTTALFTGVGGDPFSKAHTLHPEVDGEELFMNPADAGGAMILLNGSPSHTHAKHREIVLMSWTDVESGTEISTDPILNCWYPFGTHTVSLTIQDDAGQSLSTTVTFTVAPEDNVPGALLEFYPADADIADLPAAAKFAKVSSKGFSSALNDAPLGASVLRMRGKVYFEAGTYSFEFYGSKAGSKASIIINGQSLTSLTTKLPDGVVDLDVRLTMPAPAAVSLLRNSAVVTSSIVDVSSHPPIINQLATDSVARSGSMGLIKGFLLREPASVTVGGKTAKIVTHTPTSIEFEYPELPPGPTDLVVTRVNLQSNTIAITVAGADPAVAGKLGGPFGVQPQYGQKEIDGFQYASRVIFCHGKLYVATAFDGEITEIELDSEYNVVAQKSLVKVPEPRTSILGLACDPQDNDATFKLYFSQSLLFAQNGKIPKKEAPYYGRISYIEPNSATPNVITTVIDNLSVANGDHSVNAIDFMHDGHLLIAIGAQSNAGIPGNLGYLPENPTSACILKADIHKPGFNGVVTYDWLPNAPASIKALSPGLGPMDQRVGDWVEMTNPDIQYYAVGTRNPFGLKVTQKGDVSVTINGPNLRFGAVMSGIDKTTLKPIQQPDVQTEDGMYTHLAEGCYAGSPNVARCRAGVVYNDARTRECTFTAMSSLVDKPPAMCAPTAMIASPLTGQEEYDSYAFNGAYHGRFFIPSYKKHMIRYNPDDNKYITDKEDLYFPASAGVDTTLLPGGALAVTSNPGSKLLINYVMDKELAKHGNPTVMDIRPNRGTKAQTGPNTFVIGGANFDKLSGVPVVTFGNVAATDVAVSGSNWIKGSIPANSAGTCETDVNITFTDASGTSTKLTLPGAFCYLA